MEPTEHRCDHFDCACPPFVRDQRVTSGEWDAYIVRMGLGVPGNAHDQCELGEDCSPRQPAQAPMEWYPEMGPRWQHTEQSAPVRNDSRDIQQMVLEDMAQRYRLGVSRYGTGLQAHNGRDMMRDLYEELLDACVYIRGVMEERG